MRLKCAVCIAFIGGIAFIGFQTEPALEAASSGPAVQPGMSVAVAEPTPLAEGHAPQPSAHVLERTAAMLSVFEVA